MASTARTSIQICLLAVACLGLGQPATGQGLRWDIPHRGAHVYRRTTSEFAVTPPPSKLRPVVAIASGKSKTPHRWRYFTSSSNRVPKGFERPDFDDSGWQVGEAGFGPDPKASASHRTVWKNTVLCARTTCSFGRSKPKALWFQVDHDDGVRIWLNGELVVANNGYGTNRSYYVTGRELSAWKRGDNQITIKCTNTGGSQYFDLGLDYFPKLLRNQRKVDDLKKAIQAEQRQASSVRRKLFGPYRPPAMLLQGELDPGGSFVQASPVDLREIAWWVATDLRIGALGGNVKLNADRMYELGDLRVRGRAGQIDADGWQTITATVKTTKEPAAKGDSKSYMKSSVFRFVHHGFDGKLKVRRRIELREAGAGGARTAGARVIEFETELAGNVTTGEDSRQVAAGLQQRERWLLTHTHDNQDTEFRLMVKKAIEKGVKQMRTLLKKPAADRLLKAEGKKANRTYQSGRLAIGLLALIKGGVPKDDPVLVSCLNELRKRTLVDSYSLGNALMALEAYYQPATEISLLRSGSIDRPKRREIPDADRELMAKWVERLLKNIDTRVDENYLVRFNYVAGGRFDNSVHQYGLLGLYAAHLCGVEVQPIVWEAAANHLIDCQAEGGKRMPLELMDYRTHTRLQFDPEARLTSARLSARSNGWSYTDPRHGGVEAGVWGSMTCAGITGLAICQAALLDYPKIKRRKLQSDANRARNDGFAWLAKNLTVRFHPDALTRQRRWLYYYLYGLERAALLSGVALIQDRDWYFEGAMMLVRNQLDNGDWAAELTPDQLVERNAMAILFLKQSTSPVLTGK